MRIGSLVLPYLNKADVNALNQLEEGFSFLHRFIANTPETPLSILCLRALVSKGLYVAGAGQGRLNGMDMNDQTAIDVAKRMNKKQFFEAIANYDFDSYVPALNKVEKQEADLRAENERKMTIINNGLNKCLAYILKNEAIEKHVTDANQAHFLKGAAKVLTNSPSFSIFKDNLLNRPNYEVSLYSQFKIEAARAMRDLKIRLNPSEVAFDEDELTTVFSNAVITLERALTVEDANLKAHQEIIHAQEKVVQIAIENKNALSRQQEAQRQRQNEAAHQARMRGIIRLGINTMEAQSNGF